ncbi:hypothetical protein IPN35_00090 [Candidatus Peregrinibacteria bacterium]|nr:MAG: hypothetical protein IPN35_00090 [Candidatus Peregrinibacteria bacterium]
MLNKEFVKKHKTLLQSIVVFPSWLLVIYAGTFSFLFLFPLFFSENKIFIVSALLAFIGIFIVGINSIKEKAESYLSWFALSISILFLTFLIPNGTQFIYLFLASIFLTLVSYFTFSYEEKIPHTLFLKNFILLIIFISHVFILAHPQIVGISVKEEGIQNMIMQENKKLANMDPVEFSKTKIGKKMAINIYELSPFTTQEKLETAIQDNPNPMIEAQKILLDEMSQNPYFYILSVYLHPIFEKISEKD